MGRELISTVASLTMISVRIGMACQLGPVAGLTQVLTEGKAVFDTKEIEQRQNDIEFKSHPIISLHPDILDLTNVLYIFMKENSTDVISLRDDVYDKYSKALAKLESSDYITFELASGCPRPLSIVLSNPEFVIYAAVVNGEDNKLGKLFQEMENAKFGECLDGVELSEKFELPIHVIGSFFKKYEDQGYGECSKMTGVYNYRCMV
ncbi:hypothetical protein CJF42_25445 [Pseudoalteromonas sp. NBT06-2]|uniref:hypothetical protein n=1 Tax=Pseudoalteromonas sp. NBT06-2 TaxID=2025950 RepID=UPI000BA6FCE9|nr:hypothetical protein [Pseudoalteromonas sp. NBT06-2]PAJ71673.1 hypothetical protein CJF42_25445 [Pseudoalteromonas sp. NBT06-2]